MVEAESEDDVRLWTDSLASGFARGYWRIIGGFGRVLNCPNLPKTI